MVPSISPSWKRSIAGVPTRGPGPGCLRAIVIRAPLRETHTVSKYDVVVNVFGGGVKGQAEAIRHGIARALQNANPAYRPTLKALGFLTRDAREKERKKYGLHKARKATQFSKR